MKIQNVTFFGSSESRPGDPLFEEVKKIASAIAKSGRTIINGGGPGIMLAATIGAKEAKGKTKVVYFRPEITSVIKDEVAVNFADESSEESNYVLRTKKLLELGDAYIVFNGATGTLSEFAMAWGVARLYIDRHKPLLLYGNFWPNLIDEFKKHMMIRPEELEVYTIVNSPHEVMDVLERYER